METLVDFHLPLLIVLKFVENLNGNPLSEPFFVSLASWTTLCALFISKPHQAFSLTTGNPLPVWQPWKQRMRMRMRMKEEEKETCYGRTDGDITRRRLLFSWPRQHLPDFPFASSLWSHQSGLKTQAMLSSSRWACAGMKLRELIERDVLLRRFLVSAQPSKPKLTHTPESIQQWVYTQTNDRQRHNDLSQLKQWKHVSVVFCSSRVGTRCAASTSWGMPVVFVSQTGSQLMFTR